MTEETPDPIQYTDDDSGCLLWWPSLGSVYVDPSVPVDEARMRQEPKPATNGVETVAKLGAKEWGPDAPVR